MTQNTGFRFLGLDEDAQAADEREATRHAPGTIVQIAASQVFLFRGHDHWIILFRDGDDAALDADYDPHAVHPGNVIVVREGVREGVIE